MAGRGTPCREKNDPGRALMFSLLWMIVQVSLRKTSSKRSCGTNPLFDNPLDYRTGRGARDRITTDESSGFNQFVIVSLAYHDVVQMRAKEPAFT